MLRNGKITEPSRANIRDHERRTARALANTGYDVEFILKSEQGYTKSADLLYRDIVWEAKSPKTQKLSQLEKNLKRANKQSSNIIIDSQRMKGLPDKKILQFLIDRAHSQKSISRLIFINRKREIIDVTNLS